MSPSVDTSGHRPRGGIAGSHDIPVFTLWGNHPSFPLGLLRFTLPPKRVRDRIPPRPFCKTCDFPCSTSAIVLGVKWRVAPFESLVSYRPGWGCRGGSTNQWLPEVASCPAGAGRRGACSAPGRVADGSPSLQAPLVCALHAHSSPGGGDCRHALFTDKGTRLNPHSQHGPHAQETAGKTNTTAHGAREQHAKPAHPRPHCGPACLCVGAGLLF